MKIVILMSVYNGEKYIDKQLESIYGQSIRKKNDIQLIVRDDGSNDHTINILEEWSKKMNIVISKGSNIGAKESFYKLLYEAPEADYYAFCDQDDIWKENKLEKAISAIERINNKAALYFSNLEYIDENDIPMNIKLLADEFCLSLQRILMCNPANGCTMLWNKNMHQYLSKHHYQCFTMHDEYVLTVAYLSGQVIYDFECEVYYRVHGANVTQQKNFFKKIKLWKWIWFGNRYASLDKRASELLKNIGYMKAEDRRILESISNYKRERVKLLKSGFKCENPKIERSFRIRMLMGIL